ncbi:hypothetical protein OE88DRAFT_975809 [Heliocybe sulcata]|uniref:Uncharacterized protein n=1 Tax=Heliocybe sulcata TaxID=5364 RepID=A0A5C3NMP9_9AGAM|nr:hypothetical protein OE88DRAFT_975809 [Heliocybe sulcata]
MPVLEAQTTQLIIPLRDLKSVRPHSAAMCKERRVNVHYGLCGHVVLLPEELIQCEDKKCKFSPMHPANCPDCRRTCWQYRQFPETFDVHKREEYCPTCAGQLPGHRR